MRRVGGTDERPVDVRVIAATNVDLRARVAAGQFREDVFYRLNVLPIHLPPLRERREDIPALAAILLERHATRRPGAPEGFTAEALSALVGHRWPGNVRELENAIARAVAVSDGPRIELEALPEEVSAAVRPRLTRASEVHLSYREVVDLLPWTHMIYTGPIDAFFNFKYGKLPYRSLRFEHVNLPKEQFQQVGTVNYPNDYGYTRISEFKHITGQHHPSTSVVYEYPCAEGDPYYPVPRPENAALYKRYEEDADAMGNVTFVGRLATYKYYNMDQVVGQALTAYKRLCEGEEAAALTVLDSVSGKSRGKVAQAA